MMFCYIYQWYIGNELDKYGQIRSSILAGHVARCSRCSDYIERANWLNNKINAAFERSFSDSRIEDVQAVIIERLSGDGQRRVIPSSRSNSLKLLYFSSGSIAAVLVFMAGIMFFSNSNEPPVQDAPPIPINSGMFTANIPLQQAFLTERPMWNEADKLIADAQRAVNFLRNCAPSFVDTAIISDTNDNPQQEAHEI